MTPLPTAILDELEKALEKASPAPWRSAQTCGGMHYKLIQLKETSPGYYAEIGIIDEPNDTKLIILLRSLAPLLIAAARERDELKQYCQELREQCETGQKDINFAVVKIESLIQQRDKWREDAQRLADALSLSASGADKVLALSLHAALESSNAEKGKAV